MPANEPSDFEGSWFLTDVGWNQALFFPVALLAEKHWTDRRPVGKILLAKRYFPLFPSYGFFAFAQ